MSSKDKHHHHKDKDSKDKKHSKDDKESSHRSKYREERPVSNEPKQRAYFWAHDQLEDTDDPFFDDFNDKIDAPLSESTNQAN